MNVLENIPMVEFVMLADRAEAINGKLYIMGGAWDRLQKSDFGTPHQLSIAVSVVVPWNATNEEHRLNVRVVDADEHEIAGGQVTFAAGAPAQMKRTESQKALLAFNMAVNFPGPGTFKVKGMIDDDPATSRETIFYVNQRAQQPPGSVMR